MLHPVGPLPSAVYWRRRLLVLVGTVGVLGGGGWLGLAVATGDTKQPDPVAAAPTEASVAPPALEQVVPSLAAVQVPTPAPTTSAAPEPGAPAPESAAPVVRRSSSLRPSQEPSVPPP